VVDALVSAEELAEVVPPVEAEPSVDDEAPPVASEPAI
jgi:hypothetical protein